jgi:Putative peptidoglycan binding domain
VQATLERERRGRPAEPSRPAPVPRWLPGRRSPSHHALARLQRQAGNRAATMWLQREASCCGACATGGPCEQEGELEAAPSAGGAVQRLATVKPTIRRGSAGAPVSELQQSLNRIIGAGLSADGEFGPPTDGAVRAFQGDRGLDVDGVVGPATWEAFEPGGSASPVPGKATDPADDFRIRGLPEDSAEHPDRIFFDFAQSAIAAPEDAKLPPLAALPPRLALHGSSSEEGAGNTALTDRRIQSVAARLRELGHPAAPLTSNETAAGLEKIDYRHSRLVLVNAAGGPGLDACQGRSGAVTCPTTVPDTFRRVADLLAAATAKLAAPGALSPAERALVSSLFAEDDDATIGEIHDRMNDLRDHLIATGTRRQEPGDADEPESPFHRCGNECFSSCGGGSVAFNSGKGSESKTTFCDKFTALSAPLPGTGATVEESQEHVLIHEGAHGTETIGAADFAKGTERAFGLLTKEQALHNADSFTALARNLVRPGSAATTLLVADTGDLAGVAEIQEPLAWADRWLEGADFETSDLYRVLVQLEGDPWTSLDLSAHAFDVSMGFVADEFGLTPPPAAPVRRDREKMAAINDRYDRVRQVLKTNTASLALNRGDALVWEPGPGRTVTIPPGFELLPIRTRIELLVAALLHAFPDVREEQDGSYARLAPKLCNQRTPGFAFSGP